MQGPFDGNRTLKSYQNPPIRNHIHPRKFFHDCVQCRTGKNKDPHFPISKFEPNRPKALLAPSFPQYMDGKKGRP